MRRKSLSLVVLAIILFLFTPQVYSAEVTLAWDPNSEPDLAGYKIYYDTDSGDPYEGTEASGPGGGPSPITLTINNPGDPYNLDDSQNPEYTLIGLDGNKVYFFAVTAYDTEGFESGYSNEVNTSSTSDTTAPQISNVQVTSTTDTSAVIEWTTDEASNSVVQYGTSSSTWGSYPYSENGAGLVTSHNVTLTGLNDTTTYYFRVGS
ncbi:MAG: fibronectin type III domain-containing protein, partial [Deltaproteobacteria bacterium]